MSYHHSMTDELLSRITIDPDVMRGRPCIRGMRIRVLDVLEMLAGGMSRAEILDSYPDLEDDDISASLWYGAKASSHALSLAE